MERKELIPLVRPYMAPKNEMMPAIEDILYSGYIAEGEAVYRFEREFGDYIGNPMTVSLASGTAALHIALNMIGIGQGDEVISTALTAEPTNTTIALTGANIVWADIDENTGLLDPKSVRKKITTKTKAIMLVHYAGMVCNLDEFNKISKEHHIPLIEDAAHALGAKYRGNLLGNNSRYTCFSFQAIKHMTTVDGGMLTLVNEEACVMAREWRWFGLNKKIPRLHNDIRVAGYKYGMNNVTATIGIVQLGHLNEIISKHVSNGKYYDSNLKNIQGVTPINYHDNTECSYWLYTLKVNDRESFIKMMESKGITASPLHLRNDRHSVFLYARTELPALDKFYGDFVHIPCGWWVGREDREYIVECIAHGW